MATTFSNTLRARTVCDIPPTEYQVPYKNIGDLLHEQLDRSGDKPWLIFYSDESER